MNLKRYELDSIRLAVECAHQGQLSRAAANTHMSVSGASHRLRTLELSLGTPLFVRHAGGLAPTLAGRVFLQYGQLVLETLDQMREAINSIDLAA